MDSIAVPFIPTGLWLLTTASAIAIVLIIFGMYWYHSRRIKAALGDSRHVAELAAHKEQLQADVLELRSWIEAQKDELQRLDAERNEQEIVRSELQRLEQECAGKEENIRSLRNEAGDLENQKHLLAQSMEKIERDKEKYSDEVQRLEALKQEIEKGLGKIDIELSEKKKELDQLNGEAESQRHTMVELEKTIRQQKTELGDLEYRHNSLQKKVEDLQDSELQFEPMKKQLAKIKQDLDDTRVELSIQQRFEDEAARKVHEYRIEVEQLEKRKELASNKLEEFDTTLSVKKDEVEFHTKRASEAKEQSREFAGTLERQRDKEADLNVKIKRLETERFSLENELKNIKKELGAYMGTESSETNEQYADLLNKPPDCLNRDILPDNEFPYTDEEHALSEVRARLEDAGYHFHQRVVNAFHTALKCHDINPLTVLAGVSGTGKTLLPTAYAKLMGMYSLVIAVQPRWDSPQDMFGFYNYLEKRYKATDLARALIRMDPFSTIDGLDRNQNCSDRMFLVLLDEMNLARTEYYFSEFLSKLELRRLIGSAQNMTDRQHALIYLDTGPGRNQLSFWVDKNVLFTGTMNEDESTQTLSDKVIDRANVLRFGRPARRNVEEQLRDQDKPLPNSLGYLPAEQWKKWCRPFEMDDWTGTVIEWIDGLNDALTKIGRPFGHRVRKSILAYVTNYPGVSNNSTIFMEAFADQVEQKILPKLRGLDTMEDANNAAFDDIERIIEKTGDETLLTAYGKTRENRATGMFAWQGLTRQE